MYTITNISSAPLSIDGVSLDVGEQVNVLSLSEEMIAARDAVLPTLQVESGDETLAEKQADVAAVNEFVAASEKILDDEGQ